MAVLPISLPKILNFFAPTPKFIKKHFFLRRKLSLSKRSSALKESHFDNSFKRSLLKDGNWQSRSSNIRKCDEKNFPGLLKCTLENAAKIFSATSQHLSLKIWKRQKKFYSEQHWFPQNVRLGEAIRILAFLLILFAGILNFSRSKSETLWKKSSFFERTFSFKTILSTQRKQFRWTLQNTSAKSRELTKWVIEHQDMW